MPSLDELNRMPKETVSSELARCCGAVRWVAGVLERGPWLNEDALYRAAEEVWEAMDRTDVLEAFSHHPRIGADLKELRVKFATTASWSGGEQAGASDADEQTLIALQDGNRAYEERFGYIFIVCATGKSAEEMLALLNARLGNQPADELAIASGEQAKITRIRLEKLLS